MLRIACLFEGRTTLGVAGIFEAIADQLGGSVRHRRRELLQKHATATWPVTLQSASNPLDSSIRLAMPSLQRILTLACFLCLALTAVLGAAQDTTRIHLRSRKLATVAALPSSWHEELLTAVNNERANAGFVALCINEKLVAAAQKHSNDMVAKNFLGHTGSDGSRLANRITASKFAFSSAGENVAAGQQSVSSVMSAWMNSPGHKANILGNYTFFGAGVAQSTETAYGTYWTQVFGSSRSELCACILK